MASIICEDCGHHRYRTPANTKFCRKCRFLRDVEFWDGKTRSCRHEDCGNEFTPLHRNDHVCGSCHMGQTANLGTCALCSDDRAYLIARDIACCERCARTPAKRRTLISSLRKGQRIRVENPPTEPLRQPTPKPVPVAQIIPEL